MLCSREKRRESEKGEGRQKRKKKKERVKFSDLKQHCSIKFFFLI